MNSKSPKSVRTPERRGRLEGGGQPPSGGATEAARASHYLHAGLYFAAREPTAVTTILGSCVAVCLWEPDMKVGGINHFVLPDWVGEGRLSPRYGNVAIASLIEALAGFGCGVSDLRAKIFGGASVLGHEPTRGKTLGARNAEVARMLLEDEGIPLLEGEVGGDRGRKLVFHTDGGETFVRVL